VVDEHGSPVKLLLTAGHASDEAAAPALLEGLPRSQAVIADRGYDWQHLVDLVTARGGQAHVATQRDRKNQRRVDRELYQQRNLIERFFNKLKHFRRIATRHDKLAEELPRSCRTRVSAHPPQTL
jgi:transposase